MPFHATRFHAAGARRSYGLWPLWFHTKALWSKEASWLFYAKIFRSKEAFGLFDKKAFRLFAML
jgi:hypothetical protein